MSGHAVGIVAISISLTVSAYATNPFLDAKDDKPVSANFRGTEWNDEFPEHDLPRDIPLRARVVTTPIAKMPWGAIFKIEFTDAKLRAPDEPELPPPQYLIVTDDRIVRLNAAPKISGVQDAHQLEEDNDAAARKISEMDKPPEFERNDIYGISTGRFEHQEVLWKTTIRVKGDLCTYRASHPSGHFQEIVWKKGVGLIEYTSNYGAGREGFRLKHSTPKER